MHKTTNTERSGIIGHQEMGYLIFISNFHLNLSPESKNIFKCISEREESSLSPDPEQVQKPILRLRRVSQLWKNPAQRFETGSQCWRRQEEEDDFVVVLRSQESWFRRDGYERHVWSGGAVNGHGWWAWWKAAGNLLKRSQDEKGSNQVKQSY